MPYIDQKTRQEVTINSAGKLNYEIHELIRKYIDDKISYSEINTVMGVLECVKQEFYRRAAVPYEEDKLKENGDIRLYENIQTHNQ